MPQEDEINVSRDLKGIRGRRRLLQGGLGAAPLLMTIVSRPALGASQCFSPSGFVSMPTSQHGTPQVCSGVTPGYWKQEQWFPQWPAGFYPTTVTGPGGHHATRFSAWFPPSPYPGSTTFLDVLNMGGGPPNDVARHIVAALLNFEKGWAPVLSEALLKTIWYEYRTNGYYTPTAGIQWDHGDICTYLLSTMPV